jgi:hypothetical protein
MSKVAQLYANDAVWARFYRDGKNLGEICEEFGCSVYDLSPWLTKPLTDAIMESLHPSKAKQAEETR